MMRIDCSLKYKGDKYKGVNNDLPVLQRRDR